MALFLISLCLGRLQALVIALYNLKHHSPEMAREEYFHWKIHVAAFLEKHWVCLFGPQM